MLLLIGKAILLAVLVVVDYFLLKSMWRGAPFAPTARRSIEKMVVLARLTPGEKAADMGSGDGRIVIALARAGAEAHGYETNPLLVWLSRRAIARAGLKHTAFIHRTSFWGEDLSRYAVVTVFGIGYIMERLEQKLQRELRPGARVISNKFMFPSWQAAQSEGRVHSYYKSNE